MQAWPSITTCFRYESSMVGSYCKVLCQSRTSHTSLSRRQGKSEAGRGGVGNGEFGHAPSQRSVASTAGSSRLSCLHLRLRAPPICTAPFCPPLSIVSSRRAATIVSRTGGESIRQGDRATKSDEKDEETANGWKFGLKCGRIGNFGAETQEHGYPSSKRWRQTAKARKRTDDLGSPTRYAAVNRQHRTK